MVAEETRARRRAFGFLIAGTINQASFKETDPYSGTCCPKECGPCGALLWMRDNMPDIVDIYIRAVWDGRPEDLYEWQNPDGTVNWRVVETFWHLVPTKGCCGE